jgi:hypothetical protein
MSEGIDAEETNLDELCEYVHSIINQKKLDHDQCLHLHSMLLADAVAAIQSSDCRKKTVEHLMQELPKYFDEALGTPIIGQSDHLH